MILAQTRFTLFGLNPNDVATFLILVILSLPVLVKWSKSWAWFVVPGEIILLALLIGTGSRGGVLALICGGLVSVILSWRLSLLSKKWKNWVVISTVIVLGLGAGLVAFPKGHRLGSVDVSPEASAGRRLEVWSTVPAMLAAAPGGWGLDKSAEAYDQWFEPVGENVELKHLLSSHLTWLVEMGWPLRWLYLFLWLASVVLLAPSRSFNFPVWGVAVWTAFFTALFYNAAGKWWNWLLPVTWLLVGIVLRYRQKVFLSWRFLGGAAIAAGILVGLPFLVFGFGNASRWIQGYDGGNMVLIGAGRPVVAILSPSKDVLGNFYGQEIRQVRSKRGRNTGSIFIIGEPNSRASDFLGDCRLYVISGGDKDTLKKWESIFTPKADSKLLLINCRVEPDDWLRGFNQVVYAHGEFYGDSFYPEWKDFSAKHPSVSVKDIPRQEAYIADWWSLLDELAFK